MYKKKLNTTSNSSTRMKAKQMAPTLKGKTIMKQASVTASASSANTTTTEIYSYGNSSSNESHVFIWLDSNIDIKDEEYRTTAAQLQSVVSSVHVFIDGDECAKFLNKIKNRKVLIIASGSLGQQILPHIHNMPQLTAVFVFCGNQSKYESLTQIWPRIRGIFTDISVLCGSVQQAARQCDEDSINISFLSTSNISRKNLDGLDQAFMYTQLFKKMLFELNNDD